MDNIIGLFLGNKINESYKEGNLSDADYNKLRFRYAWESIDVNKEIHRMEEHEYEREYEARTATYIWTGQAILVPDPDNTGEYILLDYRYQFSHIFENLNELKKYNIIRIGIER